MNSDISRPIRSVWSQERRTGAYSLDLQLATDPDSTLASALTILLTMIYVSTRY